MRAYTVPACNSVRWYVHALNCCATCLFFSLEFKNREVFDGLDVEARIKRARCKKRLFDLQLSLQPTYNLSPWLNNTNVCSCSYAKFWANLIFKKLIVGFWKIFSKRNKLMPWKIYIFMYKPFCMWKVCAYLPCFHAQGPCWRCFLWLWEFQHCNSVIYVGNKLKTWPTDHN